MITDRKTISIMKACELVGVSRRTIYNWIASGKVEYIRTAGGSVRIFVDTLWREPRRRASSPAKKRHEPGRRSENHEDVRGRTARPRPPVSSPEQPARDHPGERRAARSQGCDEMTRARASQVVASVLDAMATAREIRFSRSKQAVSAKYLATVGRLQSKHLTHDSSSRARNFTHASHPYTPDKSLKNQQLHTTSRCRTPASLFDRFSTWYFRCA